MVMNMMMMVFDHNYFIKAQFSIMDAIDTLEWALGKDGTRKCNPWQLASDDKDSGQWSKREGIQ